MRFAAGFLLVLLLAGMLVTAGCIGGGPSSSTSAPSSSPHQTETSTSSESSITTTPESSSTTSQGQTSTAAQPTTTTTTSAISTTTTTTTESSESSSTTTATTSISPTSTTTTTIQPTTTTTTSSPTTTTSAPTEEAYWSHPWEYAPLELDGESYWITYYKYRYKVQPNQSAPVYEYIVEKSVGKENVNVCGMDMMGNTVDLGTHEAYAYKTTVTPINAENLQGKLTVTVWYISNVSEAFIYPWDILWMGYMAPMGGYDNNFVGIQFEYQGQSFRLMNPSPFQTGLFPCVTGNGDISEDLSQDLTNLYIGWVATVQFGIWGEWSTTNVLVPQTGVWSDGQGHSWQWSTTPDGTVTFSGITFKLVNFQWEYTGTPEGVSLDGKGKFSPYLPILVEGDGHFTYKDEQTGKTTVIYAYLKLEDLRLEKLNG